MGKRLSEIDGYVAKSAPFARPILNRIRKLFHQADPRIEEAVKWGTPHFVYKGIVGGMAAFKQHASFGFWKGKLLDDPAGLLEGVGEGSMCMVKLEKVSDLPDDEVLIDYIRRAVQLNEREVKVPRPAPKKRAPDSVEVPDDLAAALKKNKKARATFEGFSYSNRRDYVEWITGAKQDATRQRRLATTLEWLAEGKPRNWKYMK